MANLMHLVLHTLGNAVHVGQAFGNAIRSCVVFKQLVIEKCTLCVQSLQPVS